MKKGFAKIWASTLCVTGILALSQPVYAALPVLKTGVSGAEVTKVQTVLKEWGYFTYPNITGYYGNITKESVKTFQEKNGLTADGVVGKNTYSALGVSESTTQTSRGSQSTGLVITSSLKIGSQGSEVNQLQTSLQALGYYNIAIDGIFGNGTHQAVTAFQSANGLTVDGVVGQATCTAINNGGVKQTIELLDWSTVDSLFPRKTTGTVIDVWTGKTFNVYRLGGTLHLDAEPLTASDTETLKQIYPTWSWDRRPVIVEVAGQRIAGSMNGMPHGQEDIYDNNYAGQFCIHFLNSRTHGGNNLDAEHQAMVQEAYQSDK
jgi:peptidoglycan hydrolase-like protein with peptidoglycan-binding domain